MPHGIMFDFDGVLLHDSIPVMLDMFQQAAREAEAWMPTREQFNERLGPPLREYLQAVGREVGWTQEHVEAVREQYLRISDEWEYSPCLPVVRALNELYSRRAQMTIVSNRRLVSIRKILGQIGIKPSFFLLIQGIDESPYLKPDPRALAPSMNLFARRGIPPRNCLYVGDLIDPDMAAARDYQPPIPFVGITSGTTSYGEFRDAGLAPAHILESVADLPALLGRI